MTPTIASGGSRTSSPSDNTISSDSSSSQEDQGVEGYCRKALAFAIDALSGYKAPAASSYPDDADGYFLQSEPKVNSCSILPGIKDANSHLMKVSFTHPGSGVNCSSVVVALIEESRDEPEERMLLLSRGSCAEQEDTQFLLDLFRWNPQSAKRRLCQHALKRLLGPVIMVNPGNRVSLKRCLINEDASRIELDYAIHAPSMADYLTGSSWRPQPQRQECTGLTAVFKKEGGGRRLSRTTPPRRSPLDGTYAIGFPYDSLIPSPTPGAAAEAREFEVLKRADCFYFVGEPSSAAAAAVSSFFGLPTYPTYAPAVPY